MNVTKEVESALIIDIHQALKDARDNAKELLYKLDNDVMIRDTSREKRCIIAMYEKDVTTLDRLINRTSPNALVSN